MENMKTMQYEGQKNCRYTVPANWDEEVDTKVTSYIEAKIRGFIHTVFGEFMPLYDDVYESKNKAKIEITVMRQLTKAYMDSTLSVDMVWHPDKTMEWMSTCLHWLLNCSRTFDYQKKLMERGDEHPLDRRDFKRILKSLDTKPFKSTNICRFEELRDGYERLYSRAYKNTAIKKLVYYVLVDPYDRDPEMEQFIEHLKNGMISHLADLPKEYGIDYANKSRKVTADILDVVTSQFQRVIKCMVEVCHQYDRAINTVNTGEHASQIALWRAANAFKHNKTVSEMIDGYYYASRYGAYRNTTINMVNNAVTAIHMRDKNLINETDFPLVIENGN